MGFMVIGTPEKVTLVDCHPAKKHYVNCLPQNIPQSAFNKII